MKNSRSRNCNRRDASLRDHTSRSNKRKHVWDMRCLPLKFVSSYFIWMCVCRVSLFAFTMFGDEIWRREKKMCFFPLVFTLFQNSIVHMCRALTVTHRTTTSTHMQHRSYESTAQVQHWQKRIPFVLYLHTCSESRKKEKKKTKINSRLT